MYILECCTSFNIQVHVIQVNQMKYRYIYVYVENEVRTFANIPSHINTDQNRGMI